MLFSPIKNHAREVSFFTGRGTPENWGDQLLFLGSKGGIKRVFQIKKGRSLIFFKEIKYFVKHFRTQMEFMFTEKVLF